MARAPEARRAAATDGLDDRERLFVYHYLLSMDAYDAGLQAGYAESMAKTKCYQWVSDGKVKPHVYAAVQKALGRTVQKLEISKERVLQGLADLAFSSITDYGRIGPNGFELDMTHTTRGQASAIREITVRSSETTKGGKTGAKVTDRTTKLKLVDNRAPLVDLGRHLGVFKDDGAAAMTVSFSISGLGDAKVERAG